jgi:hypothetical protein
MAVPDTAAVRPAGPAPQPLPPNKPPVKAPIDRILGPGAGVILESVVPLNTQQHTCNIAHQVWPNIRPHRLGCLRMNAGFARVAERCRSAPSQDGRYSSATCVLRPFGRGITRYDLRLPGLVVWLDVDHDDSAFQRRLESGLQPVADLV